MMTNPEDTSESTGTNLNRQDKTAAAATTMLMAQDFFIGGINTAKNIPFIAIPRALRTASGSNAPAAAPIRVPDDQPKNGARISPNIYFFPSSAGYDENGHGGA